MGKTIAFANHKGGVGKTTCVYNVAAGFSNCKKKTLMIDLDPQANLTVGTGVFDELNNSIYDLLTSEISADECIFEKSKYLHIIGSNLDLSGAEIELSSKIGRERILYKKLLHIKNEYDFIIIDSPPSLGLLTVNALTASDNIFIPVQTEFYALHGLAKFIQIINEIKHEINPQLEISGVIATRFDKRKILNRDVIDSIKEFFGDKLMKTVIRENISIAESPERGEDIFTYEPNSYGAEDFNDLAKEMLKILK
jgi:chromosome partitioning protein